MFSGVVDASDIIDVNPTISVFIKFLVGFLNNLLSSWVHWATDCSDKLIEFNYTTLIEIKIAE